jgi:hypothetical protein
MIDTAGRTSGPDAPAAFAVAGIVVTFASRIVRFPTLLQLRLCISLAPHLQPAVKAAADTYLSASRHHLRNESLLARDLQRTGQQDVRNVAPNREQSV